MRSLVVPNDVECTTLSSHVRKPDPKVIRGPRRLIYSHCCTHNVFFVGVTIGPPKRIWVVLTKCFLALPRRKNQSPRCGVRKIRKHGVLTGRQALTTNQNVSLGRERRGLVGTNTPERRTCVQLLAVLGPFTKDPLSATE